MEDYDNLDEPTICDKVHNREAFYMYMNYKSKCNRENNGKNETYKTTTIRKE